MHLLFLLCFVFHSFKAQIYLPIDLGNRNDISKVKLSDIGDFGLLRKPRPNVPQHFHTGIDIKRPNNNYINEPIYPIAKGKVISKRDDDPYANIIIEHESEGFKFWSLYEHVAGIIVKVNDVVDPKKPIARFMNKEELNKNGWQFDHFHLEILKVKPIPLKPTKNFPERFYNSYSLVCYTGDDLEKYYYNPLNFFKEHLKVFVI